MGFCGFWFLLAVLKWVGVAMDFCLNFAGFGGVSCECKVLCFSYDWFWSFSIVVVVVDNDDYDDEETNGFVYYDLGIYFHDFFHGFAFSLNY